MARDKKNNYPLPLIVDPPRICIQLEIPNEFNHIAAFWGQVWELTYWNKWNRDSDQTGRAVADVWRDVYLKARDFNDNIGCEDEMSECCEDKPRRYRVNPTSGNIEQSVDGGATWGTAAGGFQSVIVEPVPPVTSGVAATKCDAATNLSGQVDQWITQVSNDFDTATSLLEFGEAVILAIAGAVLTVLTGGALAPVEALALAALGAALAAVFGAGKAVFDAYWTTSNKDKILCAAYCTIGDDGSFNPAQFSEFWTKCNTELPASPAKMLFMGFLSSVGKEGVNAMAASGMAADADCADCHCDDTWCFDGDFTVNSYSEIFSGLSISGGQDYATVWTSGIGWQTTNASPNYSVLVFKLEDIPGLRLLKFNMTDNGDVAVIGHGDTLHGVFTESYFNPDINHCWDGSETNPYVDYGKRSAAVIFGFHAEGVGENPFGSNNCAGGEECL